jgi:hypothetical protein
VDTTPEVRRATALAAWPSNWLRDEEASKVTAIINPGVRDDRNLPQHARLRQSRSPAEPVDVKWCPFRSMRELRFQAAAAAAPRHPPIDVAMAPFGNQARSPVPGLTAEYSRNHMVPSVLPGTRKDPEET